MQNISAQYFAQTGIKPLTGLCMQSELNTGGGGFCKNCQHDLNPHPACVKISHMLYVINFLPSSGGSFNEDIRTLFMILI